MNYKKGLGIGLLFIGAYLTLISSAITGAVIGFGKENLLGWVGILMFVVGGVLVFTARTLERKLENTEGNHQTANHPTGYTQGEIPLESLEKIREDSNQKVASGKWVELDTFRIGISKNQADYPHATSVMRYWGPQTYQGSSRRQLDKLYKLGKIGKTHELIRGSDVYPRKNLKEGEYEEGTVSLPGKGARALHRHWELEQMYDYTHNPRT